MAHQDGRKIAQFTTAVFDLIPLVGATTGTVIVGAVALTEGVTAAAIVVGAMIAYQQIENHALQQLVYHRTVKLSPLAIAVSVASPSVTLSPSFSTRSTLQGFQPPL